MALRLLIALALISTTVLIHGFGTYYAITRLSRAWQRNKRLQESMIFPVFIVLQMVGLLLMLHLLEAGVWASVYFMLGTLPDFETAVYFSLTSYTTLGYGDVLLPVPWRLFGPFEGAVGILMFGWSTGIMVATISTTYGDRLRPRSDQHE